MRFTKKRFIKFALVALILFSSAHAQTVHNAKKRRDITKNEFFFAFVAMEANLPELCESISPYAYSALPFSSKGHQAKLYRSVCYMNLAHKWKRPELCEQVVPVSSPYLDGSKISPLECRKQIKEKFSIAIRAVPDSDLIRFFETMGYSGLPLASKDTHIRHLRDQVRTISEKPNFLKRLLDWEKNLKPKTSSAKKLLAIEYMFDHAAFREKDIKWCKKIRSNVRVTHRAGPFWLFCIFKIAVYNKKPSLCNELKHELATDSIYKDCARRAPKSYTGHTHYSPSSPRDEATIREAFSGLGYELKDLQELSDNSKAIAFRKLLRRMVRESKDTRADFLHRVQNLP